MAALHWGFFRIGKKVLLAVSLVAGGNDNFLRPSDPAASLQEIPGALYIGVESCKGAVVGGTYNRLRRQMKDRLDFVFIDGAFQKLFIFHLSPHNIDPVDDPPLHQAASGNSVPDQPDHVGTGVDQSFCEPRTQKSSAAGYEDVPIGPESRVRQTLAGADLNHLCCDRLLVRQVHHKRYYRLVRTGSGEGHWHCTCWEITVLQSMDFNGFVGAGWGSGSSIPDIPPSASLIPQLIQV